MKETAKKVSQSGYPDISDCNPYADVQGYVKVQEGRPDEIPLWRKLNLTIEEASRYSGIGVSSLRDVMKDPACPFVLNVGKKKLVKRAEFETWCQNTRFIRNP